MSDKTVLPTMDNISVIAQDTALTVLLAVLRRHNATLADDIALELTESANGAAQHLPPEFAAPVAARLLRWVDALHGKTPTGDAPRSN